MGQNTRKDPRAKVLSMTVRYRSATLGEFIEHHSYDVSRGGMFIKTPSPFPAGTLLKFEVRIAEEQRVMQGVGRVVWKREAAQPDGEPVGMGIKFIKIDEASRAVIERLIASRGGESVGAYDKSPEGMFPSGVGSLPPPEDRTVMKPASELLDEALRKTGTEVSPASSRGEAPDTEKTDAPGLSPSTPPLTPSDSDAPPARIPSLESLDKTQRSLVEGAPASSKAGEAIADKQGADKQGAEKSGSAAKPAATEKPAAAKPASVDEDGGGARTPFLFLLAALVAAGIWILTKRSGPPVLTPPPAPEAEPALSAAPLTPPPPEPSESEVAPPVEEAPAGSAAPSGETTSTPPAASTASAPTTPAPTATTAAPAAPVVVKKPKPVVAPKVEPTTPSEPSGSATTAPTTTPPAPTTPTSTPTPPAPAPAPAPASPENPY